MKGADMTIAIDPDGPNPWCDHLVPPDVAFDNYVYYVQRMKALSQQAMGVER
jgi:hypothetical protein